MGRGTARPPEITGGHHDKITKDDRKSAAPAMHTPPVVSPQDWEAARQQMLVKEKASMRAHDALAAERRRMPWMAVEKEYAFEGPNGQGEPARPVRGVGGRDRDDGADAECHRGVHSPDQPTAMKMEQVRISVAIVIPEIGFEDDPIRPTMRDDTVTKKKPNTITRSDARTLPCVGMRGATARKSASRRCPPGRRSAAGRARSSRATPIPSWRRSPSRSRGRRRRSSGSSARA